MTRVGEGGRAKEHLSAASVRELPQGRGGNAPSVGQTLRVGAAGAFKDQGSASMANGEKPETTGERSWCVAYVVMATDASSKRAPSSSGVMGREESMLS